MSLPASLAWIEVDHADVIADKEARLQGSAPTCRLERVGHDLSVDDERRTLLASIGSRFRRVLVMTEGLLVYLAPEDAMGLARDIRAMPNVFRWIADLNNRAVNEYVAKRTREDLQGTARMQFGPDEGPLAFEPLGWTTVSATSIFKAAGKLGRLPFPSSRACPRSPTEPPDGRGRASASGSPGKALPLRQVARGRHAGEVAERHSRRQRP